jgi:hypothetical protein
MADLRLVGVHEDGEHLLLSGTGGEIYLLPLDEALRLATARSPRRPSQTGSTGTRLSPREIQSQIRGGASASDVAEHSGLPLEQVRRYEGPVLAEREHVAQLARRVDVGAADTDGYRSVFGDQAVTLDEMVNHRLGAFGIDTSTLRWDAWRVHDGSWSVTADFAPGTEWAASSIGEPPPARWTFHTGRKSLFNANRWAQQLSELEPVDGPVPERRLSAVADRPFDFETDAAESTSGDGTDGGTDETPAETEAPDGEPTEEYPGNGLLDMLRTRRGQRLGLDEDGDDELAAMLGAQVPAAHARDAGAWGQDATDDGQADDDGHLDGTDGSGGAALTEPAATEDGPAETDTQAATQHGRKRLRAIPFLSLAPNLHHHDDAPLVGVGEVSTDTREITLSGAPSLRHTPAGSGAGPKAPAPAEEPHDAPSDSEVAERLERKATAKPKRSSVPSWDEIVFGTKGD